jgi:putative N6-adenine-specific DNA methylase
MSIFNIHSPILVTCPKRISGYLRSEIEALELPIVNEMVTGVETEGTLVDAMRLNLHVRTGHRVLFLVKAFSARDARELYDTATQIEWEQYIDPDGYLSVISSVENPTIRDTQFANVKCKDAIVDRIREATGRRPDSGAERSGVVVFLYWKDSDCAIYIDTSGEPLSRRGYRKLPWKAPMQETLAAAVIMATSWDGYGNFINPMCGSGTLAIEAALIALDRAPGLQREHFAFEHLLGFDPKHWEAIRKRARSSGRRKIDGRIIATDISADAIVAARKNAIAAGIEHLIEFSVCDFASTPVPDDGGVVLLNPEYGERLGDIHKLEGTYARIGDFFKQHCQGYTGYVFTASPDLSKRIGLKTSRKIPFYNTTLDCRLLEYQLYKGTKKAIHSGDGVGDVDGEHEPVDDAAND